MNILKENSSRCVDKQRITCFSIDILFFSQIKELEDQLNWFNIVIARREAKRDVRQLPLRWNLSDVIYEVVLISEGS